MMTSRDASLNLYEAFQENLFYFSGDNFSEEKFSPDPFQKTLARRVISLRKFPRRKFMPGMCSTRNTLCDFCPAMFHVEQANRKIVFSDAPRGTLRPLKHLVNNLVLAFMHVPHGTLAACANFPARHSPPGEGLAGAEVFLRGVWGEAFFSKKVPPKPGAVAQGVLPQARRGGA